MARSPAKRVGWHAQSEAMGVVVSMDGRGRWMDNVFVERLWRTVKYKNIYLKAYATVPELEDGLSHCFDF